ncbi:MAG: SUMF1/EgtB/PvdO family nonheme iron enzyme [Bacteroidales bacterium]|nr:SUMF1/EgtB/PvdO family nonheme iron enzyme [Bacteroidales bacterium]
MLTCFCASAQIAVTSFSLLENDLTANTSGTMVTDQNGDKCALIKVETTQTGFTFNAGQLGVTKTEQHPGEIWVYVPAGVRRISISHPQLGVLRDYDLGMSVQKAKTYLLKLTTGTVTTIVEESLQSQYLIFTVSPADALVEVNQEMWQVNDGVARKLVPFGTYDYRIVAADYHPEVGKVTVNDANAKKQVSITLKPAFGWIDIGAGTNSDLKGANVYVDNKLVGSIPVKTERLASGSHSVKVVKELYKSLEQTVLVQDNQTTQFVPQMVADFGNVTLMVDNNAEIWVNDEQKGKGRWSGKLASGEYLFEARLANHRKTTLRKVITPQATMQTYNLQVPVPICGNLDVSSNPDFAEIWLDGKKVGETPMLLPKVLVGQHEIVFKKQGCGDFRQNITLAEGETKTVSGNLTKGREANPTVRQEATINVEDQTITVNGVTFKMIFVKGGTFKMGATREQGIDADDDEKPAHSVTLSDYSIGQTEVTQALWKAVMGSNPSYFKGDNLPVEQVSWNDCQEFIKKLNQLTGKTFRLPTEAEWEYAARGGNKSKGYKYSGSNAIRDVAWYYGNCGSKTHDVATKQPNELGLYDMSGNVWELCQDWKGSYSSTSQTNPVGPSFGSFRVNRGGSWIDNSFCCRVSCRRNFKPDYSYYFLGLRLVLSQ